jgi:glutamate---cysteine ligase / carboxylate-amine ligase
MPAHKESLDPTTLRGINMHFAQSDDLTFGMELEFQIVSGRTGRLSPSSLELWDELNVRPDAVLFSLEATQSTIELNSSVHSDTDAMLREVLGLTSTLCTLATPKGLIIRGGGTQLTQYWEERMVTPSERATELTKRFGFLPKRFSTYGMHVHIGASTPDKALMLGNFLQSFVPLFIAMSAASPFLQMTDTGFCASRPLEPLIYPHGGSMPRMTRWSQFEETIEEIFSTKLASSLKDIYWDVRPKPEFGTIEVRVFDTPLSVYKAVAMAAFTRACAALVLCGELVLPDTPVSPTAERVSRFMACRDGLDASLFDPISQSWMPARQLLATLCDAMAQSKHAAVNKERIAELHAHCSKTQDATIMRDAWKNSQVPHRTAPDVLLAYYSDFLGKHLAMPLDQVQTG